MNRGFAEEILAFVLIIFSVIIMTIFFASENVLKGGEVTRSIRGRNLDESANSALQTLTDNKLEKFNKTYMEMMIDAQLQGGNETHVYYGRGLGTIPVRDVVNQLMNNYFGEGGWRLVLKTEEGETVYGVKEKDFQLKYVSKIPVPPSVSKNNMGNVTLHV